MSGFTLFLKRALSSVTPDPIYSSPHQLDTCVCPGLLYWWCSLSSWAKNIRSVLFPHEPKRAILVAVVLQVSSITQMQTDVWVVSVSSVTCTSKQFQHYKLQFSADDNEEEVGVDNDVWARWRGEDSILNFHVNLSALTVRTSTGHCCVERKINAKSFQLQFCLSMSRR